MKNKNTLIYELVSMLVGEFFVSAIVCVIFLVLNTFSLSVVLGCLLGSFVTVFNFWLLMLSTNRTIDKVMLERGDGEMDDEAAKRFAAEHGAKVQTAVKISYIVRTLSIVVSLILAFVISNLFHVVATVVPLLMYQPILMISQWFKGRGKNNG